LLEFDQLSGDSVKAMAKMTPVSMSVEDVHAAAGLSGVEMPTAPEAGELDNWAQEQDRRG
jgi:hypothetical protein